MATRNISPGGALLRASRLFSVPAPLPRPTAELVSTVTFNSSTATLPYPTHLSVTTPPSSLSKGDWGLKRPLPLRSTTKSSTPLIRVESVDTFEHITEYASAADHTLTLQKWQEMNLPLSTPGVREDVAGYISNRRTPGRSVFEEDLSATSRGNTNSKTDELRWRFEGPWLAGLTVGEFNEYVQKTIRERKEEFEAFLRNNMAVEETKTTQRAATERGEDLPPPVLAHKITDDQLRVYIRELRQDRASLFRLIRSFLDLPPAPAPGGFLGGSMEDAMDSMGTRPKSKTPTIRSEDFLPRSNSPYVETGPPKTHPSAGLSYLRTDHIIYNHPIHGPQERPAPIQGRVVVPKNAAIGSFVPKVGIAGVVADAPKGYGFNTTNLSRTKLGQRRRDNFAGLLSIDPEKLGGSKIYLHPTTASIDPNGRISLKVIRGDDPAAAVHGGKGGQVTDTSRKAMRPNQSLRRPPSTTKQWYGLESQGNSDDNSGTGKDRWSRNDRSGKSYDSSNDGNEVFDTLRSLLVEEANKS